MPRRARSWMVAAVAALALAACKKDARPPDKTDPVSIDEAKALAAEFGAALTPCDATKVGRLLDGTNLIRRAVQRTSLPRKLRRQLSESLDDGGAQIAGMLCQGIGADATYVLLRIKEVDGQPHPLFRLISDDAVNYHELELGKSKKDHVVRVVDIRVYATGDMLSDSMAQMFDQFGAVKDSGDAMQLKRTTEALNQARQSGDSAEVRRLLGEMPAALRNTKPMRLAELMVGADLDEAIYSEIMERYRRDFPDDPSADVVSVDYFFLKKDVARTVEVLDKLDKVVGGDPYLWVLKTNAYLLDSEPAHTAEAVTTARKAVEAEPTLEAAWWSLTAALLTKGDHAALAPVVDTLKTKFQAEIDPASMAGNELWSAYFASEAYKQSQPKVD